MGCYIEHAVGGCFTFRYSLYLCCFVYGFFHMEQTFSKFLLLLSFSHYVHLLNAYFLHCYVFFQSNRYDNRNS